MQPSILTQALAQATTPEPTPAPPAASMTLGSVPSDQYPLLLDLMAVANAWQTLQVARQAWDAADAAGRASIDANVKAHLRVSADIYASTTRDYDALPELTQQQMLEYDTARAGAQSLVFAEDQPDATAVSLFDAVNDRINALVDTLPAGSPMRDMDWRPPAIYPHLPVFHMEFGERHLELRLSVV